MNPHYSFIFIKVLMYLCCGKIPRMLCECEPPMHEENARLGKHLCYPDELQQIFAKKS